MQQTLEQDVSSDACLAARCVDTIKKVVFCIELVSSMRQYQAACVALAQPFHEKMCAPSLHVLPDIV